MQELRDQDYTKGPENRMSVLAMYGLELTRTTVRPIAVIEAQDFRGTREIPEALFLINLWSPFVVDLEKHPHLREPFYRLLEPDQVPVTPDEWIRRFNDFRDIYLTGKFASRAIKNTSET